MLMSANCVGEKVSGREADLDQLAVCRAFHLFSQAKGPHISPYLFDISEAFHFWTSLACIIPAQGIFTIRRPDGILFLVVDDHLVDSRVFSFVHFDLL